MSNLQIWVVVENNIVMIAASIPALRALFQPAEDAPSHYYNSGVSDSRGRRGASYKMATEHRHTVGADTRSGDADSEEHILTDLASNNITKTTDVRIVYGGRTDDAWEAVHISHPADTYSEVAVPSFLRSSRTPHDVANKVGA